MNQRFSDGGLDPGRQMYTFISKTVNGGQALLSFFSNSLQFVQNGHLKIERDILYCIFLVKNESMSLYLMMCVTNAVQWHRIA